jgi:hypothetical protein
MGLPELWLLLGHPAYYEHIRTMTLKLNLLPGLTA